jgi:hypothetical protein
MMRRSWNILKKMLTAGRKIAERDVLKIVLLLNYLCSVKTMKIPCRISSSGGPAGNVQAKTPPPGMVTSGSSGYGRDEQKLSLPAEINHE